MNKKDLLDALQKAESVYAPVFFRNGKDWKYCAMDKEQFIDEVKNTRDSQYLAEVSPSGLWIWLDIPTRNKDE